MTSDTEKDETQKAPASKENGPDDEQTKKKKDSDWINHLILEGIKLGVQNSGDIEDADFDPLVVFEKLQEIMDIVVARVDQVSNDLPWWCFVSLVQMNEAIKKQHPEYRDRSYRDGGEDVSTSELEELSEGVALAELAYEERYIILKKKLRERDYVLLRHETSCEPGRVGNYIAINHIDKTVLVGLKGTSTFSDLVTDATGKTIEHTLENPLDESYTSKEIRCHEGIWTAALTMADDLEELISNLFLPSGYKILICGHSLGAGTACLLGVLLRSRIAELRGGDKLRVLAIAPPPVLNHEAALAASSFCTSLVNNNDIVPRLSLSNLVQLAKLLVRTDCILQEQGRKPQDVGSALRYAQDLMQSDSEPLLSCEELDEFFDEENALLNHEDNLFVPGRVVTMWYIKKSSKERLEGDAQNAPDKVETAYNDEKENDKEEEAAAEDTKRQDDIEKQCAKIKEISVVASSGGKRMLRQLELESSFLDDHMTDFYQASLQALLQKMGE